MLSQTQPESYLGNPNVKRDGINQKWDQTLVQEYAKCMQDPVYFCEKYVKVIALIKDWYLLYYILIKNKCLSILIIIDLILS